MNWGLSLSVSLQDFYLIFFFLSLSRTLYSGSSSKNIFFPLWKLSSRRKLYKISNLPTASFLFFFFSHVDTASVSSCFWLCSSALRYFLFIYFLLLSEHIVCIYRVDDLIVLISLLQGTELLHSFWVHKCKFCSINKASKKVEILLEYFSDNKIKLKFSNR